MPKSVLEQIAQKILQQPSSEEAAAAAPPPSSEEAAAAAAAAPPPPPPSEAPHINLMSRKEQQDCNDAIERSFWAHEGAHHFFGGLDQGSFIGHRDAERAFREKVEAKHKKFDDKTWLALLNAAALAVTSGDIVGNRQYNKLCESLGLNVNNPGETQPLNYFLRYYSEYRICQEQLELYKQLFHFCKIVADQIEHNSHGNDTLAYDNAYKILVIFPGRDLKEKVKSLVASGTMQNLPDKVHDVVTSVNLPTRGDLVTLADWQKFIKVHGKQALDLFAIADRIEQKKAEISLAAGPAAAAPPAGPAAAAAAAPPPPAVPAAAAAAAPPALGPAAAPPAVPAAAAQAERPTAAEAGVRHTPPEDFADALRTKVLLSYKNAADDAVLAQLCLQYHVSEEVFDRCLALNPQRKQRDNLPAIVLDGSEIEKNGYWLVKLPIDDPRAYILGEITNCCQSIGGHSERCVIDGVMRENNGFYVLLHASSPKAGHPLKYKGARDDERYDIDYERYDIVGQGYAWRSREGNLVFDSWENLRPEHDDVIVVDMLQHWAQKVSESEDLEISRVTIGNGGKTPGFFEHPELAAFADSMLEGYQYGDSRKQAVVYESERLKKARTEIVSIFPGIDPKIFVSIRAADRFLSYAREEHNVEFVRELGRRAGNLQYVIFVLHRYVGADNLQELLRNLAGKSDDVFKALFSLEAIRLYQETAITIDELIDLDVEKIKVLTSPRVIEAYKAGASFAELKNFDVEKIKALISYDAIRAYRAGASFAELKNFDVEKIKALTSYDAIQAYKEGVSFAELKNFDTEKIKVLTSPRVIEACKAGAMFADLKDIPRDKFEALTSYCAIQAYKEGVSFAELKNFDTEKIKALTSYCAIQAYKEGVSFAELKNLDTEKIKALTSDNAIRACHAGARFADLKDMPRYKFEELTSPRVIEAYHAGARFADLKDMPYDKFEVLTSPRVIEAYHAGARFADLKDMPRDKFEVLTSPPVIELYHAGARFADLKDMPRDKFEVLTSPPVIELYHAGARFAYLKDMPLDRIKMIAFPFSLKGQIQSLKGEVTKYRYSSRLFNVVTKVPFVSSMFTRNEHYCEIMRKLERLHAEILQIEGQRGQMPVGLLIDKLVERSKVFEEVKNQAEKYMHPRAADRPADPVRYRFTGAASHGEPKAKASSPR